MFSNVKSFRSAWPLVSAAVVTFAAFSATARGQQAATSGYVDDWSTHHVTFSDPGTEQDAVKSGRYEQWLKVVNSPRYQMQQAKRGAPALAPTFVAPMPNPFSAARSGSLLVPVDDDGLRDRFREPDPGQRFARKKYGSSLEKDWSMSVGATSPSSLTITATCTTNCSGDVSGSSTITISGPTGFTSQPFTGSAPVAEVETVQFSFSTAPAAASSFTIGSITYIFVTALGSPTSSQCDVLAASSTTGAGYLDDAVNYSATGRGTDYSCGTAAANSLVTATIASRTVTLTAKTAGSVGFTFSQSGTTSTTNTQTAAPSDGINSATTFKYTTNSVYDTQSQLAADLVAAIGSNTTVTGVMTVVEGTGGNTNKVTFTAANGLTYSVSDATFTALSGTGNFTGGVTSTVQANTYPAKYSSLGTAGASCSDYVVYPTGFTGSSSQASIVGYKDLYGTSGPSGTGCGSGASPTVKVPTVAFAYNTGGNAGLSPVISFDGTQVVFVESVGTAATLVIMKPSLTSGGTVGSPATDIGSAVGLGSYRACTAPCYTTITFNGSANDSNSSPFYDYNSSAPISDTLWVGDDSGKLHQFTGVFNGTPAETTTNGWPATASAEASPILTSPVYDFGASGLLFVGDATGFLHSVTVTGATRTVLTSNQLECGNGGFVDGPVLDPSTENVYVFIGDGCDATPGNSHVNRFATGTSISASYGPNNANLANAATNDTGTVMYQGDFDNTHYAGAGNTGNLYLCVSGRVYQVTMATLNGTGTVTVNTFNTPAGTVSDAAACSPVTEFYDGTHDWIFTSVLSGSSETGCTTGSGCLLNYNVQGAGTTGTPTAGQTVAGGASGVVIDNLSTSQVGAEQIYYTSQSNQTCAGNGTTGSGTGTCAVQASQSAP